MTTDKTKEPRKLTLKEQAVLNSDVTEDYPCDHSCRVCPFPGAKCCNDSKPSR